MVFIKRYKKKLNGLSGKYIIIPKLAIDLYGTEEYYLDFYNDHIEILPIKEEKE